MDNELDIKSGIASTLAAFFSAAGGASVGQYGPLVHFGATLGSWLKAILKLRISTDIVLGGGVAAAISTGFSAPLTGIIFAHEAILRHFSFKVLAPVALTSSTAIVISNYLWNSSTFKMGLYSATDVGPMILISIAAGPFFGFFAILFIFTILTFAKLPTQMGLKQFQSFLIAITGLNIIGNIYHEVMGLGTSAIMNLTTGSTLFLMAVAILFWKNYRNSIILGI